MNPEEKAAMPIPKFMEEKKNNVYFDIFFIFMNKFCLN